MFTYDHMQLSYWKMHMKGHTRAQTNSVRKTTNDKAREDRAIARDYQRKKAERRKTWLRHVINVQKENPETETNVENSKSTENKGQEEYYHPLNLNNYILVQF
jgi:hypothetical protein